jgi:peptidoglycan/xylan/chitin deacetylase (PgdA/CDA1 family)
MVAELQRPSFSLSYPYPLVVDAASAYKTLTRLVKAHRGLDLPRFLEHVAELCGATDLDDDERQLVATMVMTWEQVRQLHDAGMDVQSHTCSHRVLHTLLPDDLTRELVRSRAELEQRLDKSVRAIAYPVGHRIMDTPSIVRSLDHAGYLAGFTNATGPVMQWSKPHRFDIPRVAHAAHWTTPMFRTTMALPIISPVHRTRPPAPTNSA